MLVNCFLFQHGEFIFCQNEFWTGRFFPFKCFIHSGLILIHVCRLIPCRLSFCCRRTTIKDSLMLVSLADGIIINNSLHNVLISKIRTYFSSPACIWNTSLIHCCFKELFFIQDKGWIKLGIEESYLTRRTGSRSRRSQGLFSCVGWMGSRFRQQLSREKIHKETICVYELYSPMLMRSTWDSCKCGLY